MDDLTKRGPQDRARINVNEPWELSWWTQQLGVSAAQLIQAVRTVGPMVHNVKAHLGLR